MSKFVSPTDTPPAGFEGEVLRQMRLAMKKIQQDMNISPRRFGRAFSRLRAAGQI